ncbi:hypothetical protein MJA45_12880 [Paenibacillus aurantius]|uniref:Uncharacterized protein n=1 Tax=Paenibacillus aurantius TaxID=2918900 RepID=A0AA96LH74_9BACL|nr:hypothetical protein [Paenibacillus aurantius]WNQ13867.1 hypothetical protein MJA45_12880 [Paenibacillus aurantius]
MDTDLEITLGDRHSTRVLSEDALKNSDKASIDYKVLEKRYKLLFKLLQKLLPKVGGKILEYHKIHFQYLLTVLAAVENMKPVDQPVEAIKKNLDDYVLETEDLFRTLEEIPDSPFEDMNKMGLILLAPAIKQNPILKKQYNDLLDTYQNITQQGLNGASAAAETGRRMEADGKEKTRELLEKLSAMEAQGAIDRLLIETYKKKVQFIQLDLGTRIQRTRSRADDHVRRMQGLVLQAARIKRFD